jgi:DNA-binding transcriptional regulator YiaG
MQRTQIIMEEVAGLAFSAEIPVEDTADGPAYRSRDLRRFELGIACALAERGVATAESFRFMRKALGLAAKILAELLDVNAETVSRWETGKTPIPRAPFAVLGAMVADAIRNEHVTRGHLEALAHPVPSGEGEIRIDLAEPGRRVDKDFAHQVQVLVQAAIHLYGTGLQAGVLDQSLFAAGPVTISLPAAEDVFAAMRERLSPASETQPGVVAAAPGQGSAADLAK